MSRIEEAFQKHKAFIAFITVGDPDLETTERVVLGSDGRGTGHYGSR